MADGTNNPEVFAEEAAAKEAPSACEDEIELVIKNPYQKNNSFSCHVAIDSTQLDLKKHLQNVYIGNPKPCEQRIIFAGKIYEDATLLSEIFANQDRSEPQNCHLIVSSHLQPADIPEPPLTTTSQVPVVNMSDRIVQTVTDSMNGAPGEVRTEVHPSAASNQQPLRRNIVNTPNPNPMPIPFGRVTNPSPMNTSFHQQQQMFLHNLCQQQLLLQRQFLSAMDNSSSSIGNSSSSTSSASAGRTNGYQFPNLGQVAGNNMVPNLMEPAGFPQVFGSSFSNLSPAAFAVEMRELQNQEPSNRVAATDSGSEGARAADKQTDGIDSKSDEGNSKDKKSQDVPLDELIDRLEDAYAKMIRTMVLSQQLQAVSNPLLLLPQPVMMNMNSGVQTTLQQPSQYVPSPPPPRDERPAGPAVNNENRQGRTENNDDAVQNDLDAAQNLRPVDVVVHRVFAINLGLIMKLAFFVYIVAGDASYSGMVWVVAAAFLYYIYEVGFFTYLFGRELSFTSVLEGMGHSRLVQIPPGDTHQGLGTDISVLLKTFFFSLVPSWHPVRYPEEVAEEHN